MPSRRRRARDRSCGTGAARRCSSETGWAKCPSRVMVSLEDERRHEACHVRLLWSLVDEDMIADAVDFLRRKTTRKECLVSLRFGSARLIYNARQAATPAGQSTGGSHGGTRARARDRAVHGPHPEVAGTTAGSRERLARWQLAGHRVLLPVPVLRGQG